jgi:osmotically-inducible protein OsmY
MPWLAFILMTLITLSLPGCHDGPFSRTARQIQDDELTRRVKNTLLEAKRLNLSRIDVSAEDGTVYLSGEASNSDSKFEAEHLARHVQGVEAVINKLEVQP